MLLSEDKKIRKQTVTALAKRHIYTEHDLVETVPRRYRDYTMVRTLQECRPDSYNAVSGRLISMEQRVARTGRDGIPRDVLLPRLPYPCLPAAYRIRCCNMRESRL